GVSVSERRLKPTSSGWWCKSHETTWCPRGRSHFTKPAPIIPRPPVTRILIYLPLIECRARRPGSKAEAQVLCSGPRYRSANEAVKVEFTDGGVTPTSDA